MVRNNQGIRVFLSLKKLKIISLLIKNAKKHQLVDQTHDEISFYRNFLEAPPDFLLQIHYFYCKQRVD
jgi:hypothetical protein